MALDDIYLEWFNRIDRDMTYLTECFREVLEDLDEQTLAALLADGDPADTTDNAPTPGGIDRELQVYSILFQLLNLVEENAAIQARRHRVANVGYLDEPGLWGHTLRQFRDEGLKEADIAAQLKEVQVEVVLTAHPTEAKRPVVLQQHRALFKLLNDRENPILTPREQRALREEFKTHLERLWRTGEMFLQKPDVSSELENMLDYFKRSFPASLPLVDQRLRDAWRECGFDPETLHPASALPRLRFGNWVGGDRDGHPFVTADTTRTTLRRLRRTAVQAMHQQLLALYRRVPLLDLLQSPPTRLMESIEATRETLGPRADQHLKGCAKEPWQQWVMLMILRLPTGRHEWVPNLYTHAAELRRDLTLLRDSLVEVKARRLAETDVNPVIRNLDVFGFHTAALDVRQNSDFHEKALLQLFEAAGLDPRPYAEGDEETRRAILTKELESPRPLGPRGQHLGENAQAVVDTYAVIQKNIERFGRAGIGSFIVSMTRDVSDLLAVYVLAREVGLVHTTEDGTLACDVPVVPLFETVEDLENSPRIMNDFLDHPVTKNSLKLQERTPPIVQVMMGYSDSNKDSGIMASHWNLHEAQRKLAEVARKHDAEILFFHGRGGTTGRGAGPTHRFLEALPNGSLMGSFRLTEQGETIAQKYGNPRTGAYNLEYLVAGVTAAKLHHDKIPLEGGEHHDLGARLSTYSAEAYKELLARPDFMPFWSEATPIDALEQSFIGSRPSRRTGRRTLEDLRAIPWVFSWSQARYYLPGWYGVGTALERLHKETPEDFDRLQNIVKTWPFIRYVLFNVETSQASANLELMWEYAELVSDEKVRKDVYNVIAEEWERCEQMIDKLFGLPRAERRPRMVKTLGMRDRGLRKLHRQQIDLLKEWRAARENGEEEKATAMLPSLLLSINAIASGLRTTG
jgi:phosphoenolpyruvate carboxylase